MKKTSSSAGLEAFLHMLRETLVALPSGDLINVRKILHTKETKKFQNYMCDTAVINVFHLFTLFFGVVVDEVVGNLRGCPILTDYAVMPLFKLALCLYLCC